MEKTKFRFPMFGKGKIWNSNVWKKLISGIPKFGKKKKHINFQCLEKAQFGIPMFERSLNLEFQCLEKPKFRIPTIEKGGNLEFQSLKKGDIQNSNFWKKQKFRIRIFRKQRNLVFQCLEKAEI